MPPVVKQIKLAEGWSVDDPVRRMVDGYFIYRGLVHLIAGLAPDSVDADDPDAEEISGDGLLTVICDPGGIPAEARPAEPVEIKLFSSPTVRHHSNTLHTSLVHPDGSWVITSDVSVGRFPGQHGSLGTGSQGIYAPADVEAPTAILGSRLNLSDLVLPGVFTTEDGRISHHDKVTHTEGGLVWTGGRRFEEDDDLAHFGVAVTSYGVLPAEFLGDGFTIGFEDVRDGAPWRISSTENTYGITPRLLRKRREPVQQNVSSPWSEGLAPAPYKGATGLSVVSLPTTESFSDRIAYQADEPGAVEYDIVTPPSIPPVNPSSTSGQPGVWETIEATFWVDMGAVENGTEFGIFLCYGEDASGRVGYFRLACVHGDDGYSLKLVRYDTGTVTDQPPDGFLEIPIFIDTDEHPYYPTDIGGSFVPRADGKGRADLSVRHWKATRAVSEDEWYHYSEFEIYVPSLYDVESVLLSREVGASQGFMPINGGGRAGIFAWGDSTAAAGAIACTELRIGQDDYYLPEDELAIPLDGHAWMAGLDAATLSLSGGGSGVVRMGRAR